MEEVKYETFVDGMKACVPTILGYLGIGFALGVVGKGVGLSVFAIFLMSVIVYAGSAQFIICGLIAIQAPITSIIATVFLVNLRHFLMSLSVAPYFRQASLLENVGIGTLLTDESYGVLTMALKRMGKVSVAWTNGLNICAYLTWIVATVLGGLLGNFIPEPEIFGLDFALVAMFLGLFLFQVELPLKTKTRQTLLVLLSVILVLYILMWLTTPEIAVIVSALVGCLVGVITHDKY
ncbi:AzlC family ABC transporter permease [Tetragenococcus halophilus]|mgnify:FL=1|uniref:Branched-chain amino acid ABC transporter permease n=1 Tax=Tetragenococcus halophilus (strain DSM 20338 / JCM 20259 / NCIMB 9735 / NBRC 12172) TaxID=945021 RepID=A0AAN1VRQ9_TETHN|nr:AzlC family ABC transporter permease [Tetragenococcus halophilus]MCO7026051.1 AzlC family ABC transporter permease [Tetragenococcus halophilus]NWN99791.1 AzlC family ABC transporter permease [Tetragenococcus halophilus]QXN87450.1 AzlC family ABC transporter permease [Tetragenococcus halophilus]RQD33276.1 branched-chain amino acid ABC transporter permease [Tetragenococcus halophilus subsp. halophilus DSM 20339]WJS82614.1 AzlC family ABC transporter permease [Tetragenococcus halophilus]